MLVLALDTTSEHGGVALIRDRECLASRSSESAAGYSVTLFQMLNGVMEEARARHGVPLRGLPDIELYAVASGPGSFTGIRAGLAAVQAWAKAFDRPAIGVSILEAMVEEARPQTNLAASLLDARRGELYLGMFRRPVIESNGFVQEGAGEVLKLGLLNPFLEERLGSGSSITCLAREHDRLAASVRENLPSGVRWQCIGGPLLAAIARKAVDAHHQGKIPLPAELDAYYIRRTDAELHLKE